MGLDITAYKGLRKVENPQLDEDGYVVDWQHQWKPGESMKWSESVFTGRGEGVDPDTVYEFDDTYSFRAGSYSSYGYWRELLDTFKGNCAFQELINFADNEGVIGPVVSAKLYTDFVNYAKEAEEFAYGIADVEDREYFLQKYHEWTQAFKYASQKGAVQFH